MTTQERPEPNAFQRAYIEAALWATNDESDEPLDKNYGIDDLSFGTLVAMLHECAAFEAQCAEVLFDAEHAAERQAGFNLREQAGHDFWLTRNGHGCGFWDGDWSAPHAAVLRRVSEAFGNVDLYVGDDGQVYQMGAE